MVLLFCKVKNTIVTTGDYSIGLLSQTSGNLNTDTIIRVNSDGSVTPLFLTEMIHLLLLRVITQSAFLRVHLPEARACVSSLDEESTTDTGSNENNAIAKLDMAKGRSQPTEQKVIPRTLMALSSRLVTRLIIQCQRYITDVDITTHGDNAHAIAARQGAVSFNQGEIYTTGLTPRLLKFIMAAVTLKNTSAVAHQGSGIVLESS